jgi:hypothetical protein
LGNSKVIAHSPASANSRFVWPIANLLIGSEAKGTSFRCKLSNSMSLRSLIRNSAVAVGTVAILSVPVFNDSTLGSPPQVERHSIVIIGGGTGGVTVANQLHRELPLTKDIAIIDPAKSHFYQPMWTMAG